MKPGRELDKLIAEKIIGFKQIHETMYGVSGILPPTRGWVPIPHYSTDISAAWQIIDPMSPFQFDLERTYNPGNDDDYEGFEWCANIELKGNYGKNRHVEWKDWERAETAPHAICLAALQAMGEK